MDSIRWQTPEKVSRKKSADWYWALGILALAGSGTAVLLGNILFAILIAIAAFVLSIYTARKPQSLSVEINERGVVVNSTLHPFPTLKSFWVEEGSHGAQLFITPKQFFSLQLSLPLEEEQAGKVREYLLNRLPEEEQGYSFSEQVLEFFGF
jgi:hypothetical protein